ncbi:ABC transporter ATP-binding protein [bacterium]|nr:ABC transporter ATP-binding protein [bacterium]
MHRGLDLAENIVEVSSLTKRFGNFTAVDSINFNIRRGEVVVFLGPNGAGKTTTIKMMTGLLKITEGSVKVRGFDVKTDLKKVKEILGYMSQKFSLYPLLTSFENVEFFGGISDLSKPMIAGKKEELSKMIPADILNQKIEDIPPGYKQKVALFVCLLPDPEVIFLDEPTSGVDPETRRSFWQEIYNLKNRGKTLLVTTHNLDEAFYSDRVIVINRGNIILEGEPRELLNSRKADSMETLFKEAIREHEKA